MYIYIMENRWHFNFCVVQLLYLYNNFNSCKKLQRLTNNDIKKIILKCFGENRDFTAHKKIENATNRSGFSLSLIIITAV